MLLLNVPFLNGVSSDLHKHMRFYALQAGTEGMGAGPSLMFVSLPKVFAAMGKAGIFVGILFFVTAIFATLSSCISVLESIVANCMEIFHTGRKKTVSVLSAVYLAASAIIALGYSIFYVEVELPNGSTGRRKYYTWKIKRIYRKN